MPPAQLESVACPDPAHTRGRVRRRGLRRAKGAAKQRYECVAPDGTSHFFLRALTEEAPTPAVTLLVRCPEPGHADSRLQSRGNRTNKAGVWRRYRCVRPDGTSHQFQVLEAGASTKLTSIQEPPACPEHAHSSVTRNGSFGAGSRRRQRYRCVPHGSAQETHTFTPPLSREVVEVGSDSCATCNELLSPHSGPETAARHTPWTLTLYARALSELSTGASYASTALMMRQHRDRARRHLHEAHGAGFAEFTVSPAASGTGSSYTASEGKTAWHLAADLVEQYSPLLWGQVDRRMRARDAEHRAHNDAALAKDSSSPLAAPLTWLLDEQPVSVRIRRPDGRRRWVKWFVLVVVEVHWHPAADPASYPRREYRLRLLRAYPRANEQAWRLAFEEIGVRPDFVIADHASAIHNALATHYGSQVVGFVPSLFHMRRNLRDRLLKLPGTTTKVEGRRVLLDPLAKQLDVLNREDLVNLTPGDWAHWWDNLEGAARNVGAPTVGIAEQRRLYEPRVVKALPLLAAQPHLPASNAAVENRIRHLLEPFLENRKQMYRNLARLNFLLDLAVARSQGAFTDLEQVARDIRADNQAAGGWAPRPRALGDIQPPAPAAGKPVPRYASLFNTHLVEALAEDRLNNRSGGRS